MTGSWKIIHIELSEGIPSLPVEPQCEGVYVVFWWHGIPLGHQEIRVALLPMPATQLGNMAVQAITMAVGDKLLPDGFKAPLSEHFDSQDEVAPSLNSLLALERPLAQFSESYAARKNSSKTETVSVIICTRDRPEQLEQCLQSLQKLSEPPHEIIIVDNAPQTEQTRHLVRDMPSIRYVLEPRPGLSVARNTGVRHSTGEIIAFTDDDVIVHPDWLSRLRQSFEDSQVMAMTGLILPAQLETEAQLIFEVGLGNFGWGYQVKIFDQQFFRATKHLGVPVWRIGAGANMAFRRSVFEAVGHFDERLGAGASGCSEDSEYWYRVLAKGWTCKYEPSAVVFHIHRRDLKGLKHQMYQYMQGHVAALLIQFDRYKHWGNLVRLFIYLPGYYVKSFLGGLLTGFGPKYKTLPTEIFGCMAGVKFYLQNRHREAGVDNRTKSPLEILNESQAEKL